MITNITVKTKEFIQACTYAWNILDKKAQNKGIWQLRFDVEAKAMAVIMEIGTIVIASCECKSDAEGIFELTESDSLMRRFPFFKDETTTIELDDEKKPDVHKNDLPKYEGQLVITNGKEKITQWVKVTDFTLPKIEKSINQTLDYDILKTAYEDMKYCMKNDSTKPVFESLFIDSENFVVTDSTRLMVRKHGLKMKDDLLIHKSIIEYILKNMSHTITFNTSSKYKVITWHNIIIICGNDLKFPLYKMIIPQDVNLEYAVTMDVNSFLEGFKYFKAANPDREAFIWYNNKIASIVQNRWGNEYDIENLFDADVQIEGTMHTEFSFSCTLVKEIISKYKKHKTVKMKMPTFNQNPVIITCDKTPYEFVVLMPVRCKLSVFVGDEPLYPFTPKAEVEAV